MAEHYIGATECFTIGDDFVLYAERLEHFFLLNKIEEAKKKVACLCSFGGSELYKIISKLVAPKKPKEHTYDELVKKLTDHFNPAKNIIAESFKFYKRDQLQNESISEYIIELKSLAENCDFGNFFGSSASR